MFHSIIPFRGRFVFQKILVGDMAALARAAPEEERHVGRDSPSAPRGRTLFSL